RLRYHQLAFQLLLCDVPASTETSSLSLHDALRSLGSPPPTLSGNQLIAPAGERANDHGLNDAALGDRVGQFLERSLVETPARLLGVRLDSRHRQVSEPVSALRRGWIGPVRRRGRESGGEGR